MRNPGRLAQVLAAAAAFGLFLASVPAQAGLFDEIGRLFGGRTVDPHPQPGLGFGRPGRVRDSEPLRFSVGPRAKQGRRQVGSGRSRAVAALGTKPKVVARIDPEKTPDWYLSDPTLRLGDVVVLKGEVLVFQGGRLPYSRDDFAPLGQSRLPGADKRKIRDMAGIGDDPKVASAPVRRAVATVAQ